MTKISGLALSLILSATVALRANDAMLNLFSMADRVADDVSEFLPRSGVLAVRISKDGVPVALGSLFADLMSNRLVDRKGLDTRIVDETAEKLDRQDSWRLTGTLYQAHVGYLLTMKLFDERNENLRSWNFVMQPEEVAGLLIPVKYGSPQTADRLEPNDSRDSAAVLSLPVTPAGLNLTEGDKDWFVLNVPRTPEELAYTLTAATSGTTDTYMELYSPQDRLYPTVVDDDTVGQNAFIQMQLRRSGRWYLMVSSRLPYESGDYTLNVTLNISTLPPGEPDEGPDMASPLFPGISLERHLDAIDDSDWFRIQLFRHLEAGKVLKIETEGDLDLTLTLMSDIQQVIAEDDDSGTDRNALIVAERLRAGTYYAVASGLGRKTGPYRIRADIAPRIVDMYEIDDTEEIASVISPDGRTQTRSFSPSGDIDWVKFEVKKDTFFVLKTRGPVDTYMELYDGEGNFLEENNDGEDHNARIERRLTPGIYALRITPYGSVSPEETYTLIVEPVTR